MGGIGSGRQSHYGAKDTTEDFRAIDIRRWKRDGLLAPNQAFGWKWSRRGEVIASIRVQTEFDRVLLIYRHRSGSGDWKDEHYPVYLDWTLCHMGGKRPWFRCPTSACSKRVAILYGGAIFACRKCHKLAYPSQRENLGDRAGRKADTIRNKLGWEPGFLNCVGLKPKGMHWKTFEHLTIKHNAFVEQSVASMRHQLALIGENLDDWI